MNIIFSKDFGHKKIILDILYQLVILLDILLLGSITYLFN